MPGRWRGVNWVEERNLYSMVDMDVVSCVMVFVGGSERESKKKWDLAIDSFGDRGGRCSSFGRILLLL